MVHRIFCPSAIDPHVAVVASSMNNCCRHNSRATEWTVCVAVGRLQFGAMQLNSINDDYVHCSGYNQTACILMPSIMLGNTSTGTTRVRLATLECIDCSGGVGGFIADCEWDANLHDNQNLQIQSVNILLPIYVEQSTRIGPGPGIRGKNEFIYVCIINRSISTNLWFSSFLYVMNYVLRWCVRDK